MAASSFAGMRELGQTQFAQISPSKLRWEFWYGTITLIYTTYSCFQQDKSLQIVSQLIIIHCQAPVNMT